MAGTKSHKIDKIARQTVLVTEPYGILPYLSVRNLFHRNNLFQFVKLCFVLPSPRLPTSRHRSSPFVTCREDIIMVSHPNETPDCLRSTRFRWLLFLLPFEFAVKKRARPAPTLLVHRAA